MKSRSHKCPSVTGPEISLVRVGLQHLWLGLAVSFLTGCGTMRRVPMQTDQVRSYLNGREVVVVNVKNLRQVRQAAPDLCWAACLEQAMAFQGIDTDQFRLTREVHPKAGHNSNQTITMFGWRQELSLSEQRSLDGSKVWVRCDIDGGVEGPVLLSSTFARKALFELDHGRIPLLAMSNERGGGHIVSLVGVAFPIDIKRFQADAVLGFLMYDPLTATTQLKSTEELFKRFKGLVYVTTYNSATAAIAGGYGSAKYH